MKLNPFKRDTPAPNQESTALVTYDESVLQQGRFWMKTVTWTLIGTTVFGAVSYTHLTLPTTEAV